MSYWDKVTNVISILAIIISLIAMVMNMETNREIEQGRTIFYDTTKTH